MFKSELEAQLTIHQAAAWVQFRTVAAVNAAKTPLGHAGLAFGKSDLEPGSTNDLRETLREGLILAKGKLKDGSWREIVPHEWFDLPIAPLDLDRQWPYQQIVLPRDEVLNLFKPRVSANARGAHPKYRWEWVKEKASEEKELSLNKLADVMIARYEEEYGAKIGLSTMKRRLKDWGYSS